MPTQLTRLRIAGFKSFAEPVSLDILPGLTGIVGPNGCGKSNVVEALRWAMGETSARSLRGGEMDDVIFAGTTARASRNLAEVTISLAGDLPDPYTAEAELQVTRRIERGAGSAFRANGRELRARDVQTLYADLASGARSSGMVSQGRVSALVNARPEERRQVLEEAAGITGLHARRHEAELKLRAAEQNLARAGDLRLQLDAAQEGMRKQARQAARYRNISGLVRAAEAYHLAVLLTAATHRLAEAEAALTQARAGSAAASAAAQSADAALEGAEAGLPALRDRQAEAARILERRRLEAEGLAASSARAAQEAAEAEARLLELVTDLDAAARAVADTSASAARLQAETVRLEAALGELPSRIDTAAADIAAKTTLAEQARQVADSAAQAAMQARLAAAQADATTGAARDRQAASHARLEEARAAHAEAERAVIGPGALAASAAALLQAEAALAHARRDVDTAEAARAAAGESQADAAQAADRAHAARHAAEQARAASAAAHQRLTQSLDEARQAMDRLQAARPDNAAVDTAQEDAAACQARLESDEAALLGCEQAENDARQAAAEAQRGLVDLLAATERLAGTAADASARADRLAEELAGVERALAEAVAQAPALQAVADAARALREAEQALAAAAGERDTSLAASRQASEIAVARRQAADTAGSEAARLAGAARGLAEAAGTQPGAAQTVLAGVAVPAELEAALGAALGHDGEAWLDPEADRFWRDLGDDLPAPVLPAAATSMASLIQAPPALARLLAHVAVLDNTTDGTAVQHALAPGVIAVTRAGASWRWDGLVTRAGAPNPAAIRLRQARQAAEARDTAERATAAAAASGQEDAHASGVADAARAAAEAARNGHAQAEAALAAARQAHQTLAAAGSAAASRRAGLLPAKANLQSGLDAATDNAMQAGLALAALGSTADAQATRRAADSQAADTAAQLATARKARQSARLAAAAARDHAAGLARQAEETDLRLAAAAPALDHLLTEHALAATRLAEADALLHGLPDIAESSALLEAAQTDLTAARATEMAARTARQAAESRLDEARRAAVGLEAAANDAARGLAAAAATMALAEAASRAASDELTQAEDALSALPDPTSLTSEAQSADAAYAACRADAEAAALASRSLRSDLDQTAQSLATTRADLAAWQARHQEAAERHAALTRRESAARAAWRLLSTAPEDCAARAARAQQSLHEGETSHAEACARLDAAEQHLRALLTTERDSAQRLSACREAALRAEAAAEAATGAVQGVLARVTERLGEAETLAEASDASPAAEERARRRYERLTRERDEMGPVNLRADLELAELDERAANLAREQEELTTAIARLRGAIGHLNREGRARLAAVFTEVDAHFRTLFTRMMGGGRAHLALTGSDDPLLAGLEIYAEPPGKKLVSLSLLSGGEQALTALSLIFAVFRCTPAPISVLDEVDAPLDDANVERFCTLLDDVVRDTGTRFLVVTHHQLTMSRMDRLFGVTMQERGVSRLLSVDLGRAVAMTEPVLQAAE